MEHVQSQHNRFEWGGEVVRMHVTNLKGLRVFCLHMNLKPMHVIVPEISIKDFRVILACHFFMCSMYEFRDI